ncbi:MAG: hypothetical protein II413_12505 [Treponema sp.]|nr:hypothetical protein [Treponema sp.]
MYGILDLILKESEKLGLEISKPAKYRIGEYTSVAIVNDVFVKTGNEKLVSPKVNLDKFAKANKVVKHYGCFVDFSRIPVV